MKKMSIYEPAMCCPTGLCGVSIDPELLRISTVLSSLSKNDIVVERFNLTDAPQEFVNNGEVNKMLMNSGVESLPITVVDGQIIKTSKYPTNDELANLLNVPKSYLGKQPRTVKELTLLPSNSDSSSDEGCC